MSSTLLLVDAESQIRPIIERQLDPAHWTIIQVSDAAQAAQAVNERAPALIVLNVDIAKGWPLCSQLKRSHVATPLIVVSFRVGQEVFSNHQKLDTRADAYHRLPEELEMLEISLGYFSVHRSENEEESSPHRRPRRGSRVAVPSGVVLRLETAVAQQARALEDAKRQIEALEAERDAVAEKNRRQMLELMAVGPSSVLENVGEATSLRTRIATLESELLVSARREEELRDLRNTLATANAVVATKMAEVDRVQGERGALEVAANNFELALDEARTSGERTRQMFEAQVMALRSEKTQLVQRAAELEEANRTQRDLSPTGESLATAREAARREASDAADQLAEASVQLTSLANQLTQAHQLRQQVEKEKRATEERAAALEQQAHALMQRVSEAEAALGPKGARVDELEQALAEKTNEAQQYLTDKKSIDQALSTSRRLMREYATDAARKAEELKTNYEHTKELEQLVQGFTGTNAELVGALDFEKSLVESLEKDLAAARAEARAVATLTVELEAIRVHAAEVEAKAAMEIAEVEAKAAMEIADVKAKAATDVAEAEAKAAAAVTSAQSGANDDLETLRLVAQSEIDDARKAADGIVEGLRAELVAEKQRSEEAAALLQAARDAQAALEAEHAQLNGLHASERAALAGHIATVHERFDALVAYARVLEARLVSAETRRVSLELRLEELVNEVRAEALAGEIPPAMELPAVPITEPADKS